MSHDSAQKLVKMANQIGAFFAAQSQDQVAGTVEHLKKFWDPRMRSAIIDYVNHGGAGLDPVPLEAVKILASSK